MFEGVGSQATKNIADALPGVEQTVRDAVTGVQALITESLIPILAETVSQVLGEFNRLDGATVTLAPSGKLKATVTVEVEIPTFTATVNMPLKPVSA